MPPIALAPDVHLLRAHLASPADDDGLVTPADALLLRDGEPLLVDTGAPALADALWEQLLAVLDPTELRWIFVSHDDPDHAGGLPLLLERCPQARVVTTREVGRRLRSAIDVAPERCRWIDDGERTELGGRTIVALRPPAYDHASTRGLFDEATRTYWAADCFGVALPHPVDDVGQLDLDVWEREALAYHRRLAPWSVDLDPRRWHRAVEQVRSLDPRSICGAHGAPIRRAELRRAIDLLHELPDLAGERSLPRRGEPAELAGHPR